MAQITLVLPFALPAPEFAPDLARALDAPALAALMSRTSSHARRPLADAARALPHELWLAEAMGLKQHSQPAFAVAAMRGFGLEAREGTWFIINPSHIEIARSHLLMPDLRHLRLSEEHARALFDSVQPLFRDAGHEMLYGDADTWFMRADDWAGMDTATPDAAMGVSLTDCMPSGPRALAYRKLQNEVQMVWYTHPANAEREARGQPPVNAFWLWSGATARNSETVVPAQAGTPFSQPEPPGGHDLTAFETPGWLSALARRQLASLDDFAAGADTILVCGNIAAPAIAADWSGWLQQMQRLEAGLFAPLLAALKRGGIKQLRLVMSHRTGHADFTTTAMAQRKFWRRPTLERLI